MRLLVISNPVSGGGRSHLLTSRLVERLKRRGHEVEVYTTRKPGDARNRASGDVSAFDRLIVQGGDGTLNEVLNGLADPSRIPLAQMATGTANILAHELDLPYNPEGVARLVEEGSIRLLDMGLVGDRRFLMVVSSGFDAMVVREIQRTRTGTLGYAAYLRPILRVLMSYAAPRIELSVDGLEPVEGELVVVSNTRNYGGLFTLADRARCDSGHLDVCVLTRASLANLLRAIVGGLTGGLSRMEGVVYLTGRNITLTSSEPTPVEVDGDHYGSTPIDIKLKPAHVPIVVPRQLHRAGRPTAD